MNDRELRMVRIISELKAVEVEDAAKIGRLKMQYFKAVSAGKEPTAEAAEAWAAHATQRNQANLAKKIAAHEAAEQTIKAMVEVEPVIPTKLIGKEQASHAKPVLVRLPGNMHHLLKVAAAVKGASMGELAATAIAEHLVKMEISITSSAWSE